MMEFKVGDHFENIAWELFQRINMAANEQGLMCVVSEVKGDIPARYLTFTIGPGSSIQDRPPSSDAIPESVPVAVVQ